jgi:hypothetical protein
LDWVSFLTLLLKMKLNLKSFAELTEIAKMHNVFVPGPINKKDLERYIYKNVNLKNNRYQLIIDIRIYINENHEDKSKNLLNYIEDNLYKVPKLFFGEFEIDPKKGMYKLGSVLFESYTVRIVDSSLIRIVLQRQKPFFKNDSDKVEKVYTNFKYSIHEDDIMYISSENLEKYHFPKDFGFELEFEKIIRIGF